MNHKFFDLKKDKQDAMINAALKVFAENGYKRASTDEMVKEAGISKGLLFHYFGSKKGLYEFIYDYSARYMALELSKGVDPGERDLFAIHRQVEAARIRVMGNYPYLQQFLNRTETEESEEAAAVLCDKTARINDCYEAVYKKADMSLLSDKADKIRVMKLMTWVSEGVLRECLSQDKPDFARMGQELDAYMDMFRACFYAERPMVTGTGDLRDASGPGNVRDGGID